MRILGVAAAFLIALAMPLASPSARGEETRSQLAAAPQNAGPAEKTASDKKDEPSPEEVMRRRYPQPVKVADLIGLPVLDWNDSTIGFVQDVVRTPEGGMRLIVPYSSRFGWVRPSLSWSAKRLVAVPIEKVAILARQIASLEMLREDFDAAPTWSSSQGLTVPKNEIIRIAITRR